MITVRFIVVTHQQAGTPHPVTPLALAVLSVRDMESEHESLSERRLLHTVGHVVGELWDFDAMYWRPPDEIFKIHTEAIDHAKVLIYKDIFDRFRLLKLFPPDRPNVVEQGELPPTAAERLLRDKS